MIMFLNYVNKHLINCIYYLEKKYMGQKEKEITIKRFVHAKINFCLLVWHICLLKTQEPMSKKWHVKKYYSCNKV